MEFTPPLGQWLKARRRALGLRQEDLAQRAGYATITLRKIESGETAPSRELAEQLAVCLEVPVADRAAFAAFARGLEGRPRVNNLPSPATSLVGREEDAAQVRELLRRPGARLVSVIGPPGVGKTRLAIQVARELEAAFADGACFVALAPVEQAEQVVPTVAEALGLSKPGALTATEAVARCLRDRQLLLVLDNCEQVLDAVGQLVAGWLEDAPELIVLATSRAALRLSTEQVYDLAPLGLPDARVATSPAGLAACPAVNLFMQRAGAAKQGFHLTPANAAAVADICRRLDGLPLAIELAAVRTRMFTPQSLLQHLDQHQGAPLRLLTQGAHDLPARQRTLRAAIDWSYHLLDGEQQALFRHLGVFVGGCTLEAIVDCESAAGAPDSTALGALAPPGDRRSEFVDLLQALIDHSLVQREEGADGEARYTMLETLREYALEQLQASGEMEAARHRHLACFTRLAEASIVTLEPDPSHWQVMMRTRVDSGNLRAAAIWSQSDSVDPLMALRLAAAIQMYAATGFEWLDWARAMAELQGWVERALSRCADPPPRLRAMAVLNIGYFRFEQDCRTGAYENMREALRIFRELDDKRGMVFALYRTGEMACLQGNYDLAQAYMEEHLALSRELGLQSAVGAGLGLLGMLALERQEFTRAVSLMDEELRIVRGLGIKWGEALTGNIKQTLKHLGAARLLSGDFRGSIALLEEALTLASASRDWRNRSYLLVFLAHAALCTGERLRARELLQESLVVGHGIDFLMCVALADLAVIAREGGDDIAYAVLAGAAETQVAAHPLEALHVYNLCATPEGILAEAHARLGDPALAAAFAEGRAMSWEQAMAYALGDSGED